MTSIGAPSACATWNATGTPPPSQAEDNDGLAPQVSQPVGKPPSRIITIRENHDNSSCEASSRPGR